MVVCQYFLKGACKFGNTCRFEHTDSSSGGFPGRATAFGQTMNDRYHFTASKGGSNLFGNQVNSANTHIDNNTILQAFRKELQEWDTNKVWPLSCFSAQREQKCLSGLDDHSPEELRLEAYKCKESGDFQTYTNGLSSLSNQVMNRRNQLKTMSNEQLLQELQSSSNAVVSTSASVAANPFSNPSSTLFSTGLGGSTQPSAGGLFGNSQTTTSSLFGSNNQSGGGLFSTSAVKSTIHNPFAPSSTGGLFTKNTSTTTNLFASSNTPVVNPFASNTPVAPAPAGGLFSSNSSNPPAPAGGLFSTPSSSGAGILPTPFGSSTTPTLNNPFAAAATNATTSGGLFSQSKLAGSLFGTTSASQVATTGVNPLLSPATSNEKVNEHLQAPTQTSNNTHSIRLPPVTPADIEKFKAPKFVLGQIPTCPPPIELC